MRPDNSIGDGRAILWTDKDFYKSENMMETQVIVGRVIRKAIRRTVPFIYSFTSATSNVDNWTTKKFW